MIKNFCANILIEEASKLYLKLGELKVAFYIQLRLNARMLSRGQSTT